MSNIIEEDELKIFKKYFEHMLAAGYGFICHACSDAGYMSVSPLYLCHVSKIPEIVNGPADIIIIPPGKDLEHKLMECRKEARGRRIASREWDICTAKEEWYDGEEPVFPWDFSE